MKPKTVKKKETWAHAREAKRCEQVAKKSFMHLNSQFFDNRLPGSITVRFEEKDWSLLRRE